MEKVRFWGLIILLLVTGNLFGVNPSVVLETNFGNIVIELFYNEAPVTVDNFLGYVNSGFYDYLLFHRVVQNNFFIVQGGAFYYYNNAIYYWDPDQPEIINESYNCLSNLRGTIAMARTNEPHSASSQFYINTADNVMFDKINAADGYGYCVFGEVIEGMNVIDSIALLHTATVPCYNFYLDDFPYPTLAGIYSAYVLPCDSPNCSNFNPDDDINFRDFALFALQWMEDCDSSNSFCEQADLDFSGKCNIDDIVIFAGNWLNL
ncbi:MAG: hypothetical protein A2Y10_01575 [Planctomycetes bacterium GWF2_41_51]|nr:MAG: hypothetical protein A2Y10_01575 [Planctomycetes bacterium GWF2_41_51]